MATGEWRPLCEWKKDRWSMRFFQYGNAFLPDGDEQHAVSGGDDRRRRERDDLVTTILMVN